MEVREQLPGVCSLPDMDFRAQTGFSLAVGPSPLSHSLTPTGAENGIVVIVFHFLHKSGTFESYQDMTFEPLTQASQAG